jgi:hypothetical protein
MSLSTGRFGRSKLSTTPVDLFVGMKQVLISGKKWTDRASSQLLHSIVPSLTAVPWLLYLASLVRTVIPKLHKSSASYRASGDHPKGTFWPTSM